LNHEPGIVVLGSGVLAEALEKRWVSAGVPVARAGRNFGRWHADLARGPDSWRLPERPGWVFVCAGVTSREACERDPWRSRWVNVVGGIRLARHFERRGARVVFFGTDLLPEAGEYARQKEDLRRAVASMPHCLWIRLGKVIHAGLPVFAQWREDLAKGRPLKIHQEVSISPLSPEAVASCAWQLTRLGFPVPREASWRPGARIRYETLAEKWKRQSKATPSPESLAGKKLENRISQNREDAWTGLVSAADRGCWWWTAGLS
jgi:dTDP-4-dehydrorhamnose reductase